jgi:hypothetical protein
MPFGRDWNDHRHFFSPRSRMWGMLMIIVLAYLVYKMLS